MGAPVGNARCLHRRHVALHRLVVLVMDAGRQPGRGNRRETGLQQRRRNARKPLRIGAEGRELEGGDAGLDHFGDARRAFLGVDSAVKGEIDAGLGPGMGDLAGDGFSRADEIALVIGHVDDGGDAAGGGGARRPDEIFLVLLRQRMRLRIDGAGQDQGFSQIVALLRGGGGTLTDLHDLAVAHRHMAGLDHALRRNNGSLEHQIEISHGFCFPLVGWNGWPPAPGRFEAGRAGRRRRNRRWRRSAPARRSRR